MALDRAPLARRLRPMHVLVVEDEQKMAALIRRVLVAERHVVDVAPDGVGAIALATQSEPDVIVLDRLLPDIDGVTVLRLLRAKGVTAPVLMLTALGAVDDRVAGLDAGADDYLGKPFAFAELLARVRALGRRPSPAAIGHLAAGDLALDDQRHVAVVGDRTVDLSAREFALLGFFIRHAGQVVTRQQILDQVWGAEPDVYSNVVDLYVSYLRRKLGELGRAPPADRARGRVHAQGRGLTRGDGPCRTARPPDQEAAVRRHARPAGVARRGGRSATAIMGLAVLDADVDHALLSAVAAQAAGSPRRPSARDGGEATNGDDGTQTPEIDDRPPAAADTFLLVLDAKGKIVLNPSGRTIAGLPDAKVLAAGRPPARTCVRSKPAATAFALLTVPVIRNGTTVGFVQGAFVLDLHDSQSQSLVLAIVTVGGWPGRRRVDHAARQRPRARPDPRGLRRATPVRRRRLSRASDTSRPDPRQRRGAAAGEPRRSPMVRRSLPTSSASPTDSVAWSAISCSSRVGRDANDALTDGRRRRRDRPRHRPRSRGHGRRARCTAHPRWGDGAAWSMADPERIVQVLLVLIDNAVDHSPAGAPVTVRVRSSGATSPSMSRTAGQGFRPRSSSGSSSRSPVSRVPRVTARGHGVGARHRSSDRGGARRQHRGELASRRRRALHRDPERAGSHRLGRALRRWEKPQRAHTLGRGRLRDPEAHRRARPASVSWPPSHAEAADQEEHVRWPTSSPPRASITPTSRVSPCVPWTASGATRPSTARCTSTRQLHRVRGMPARLPQRRDRPRSGSAA